MNKQISAKGEIIGLYTHATPFNDTHFTIHTFEIYVKYYRHENYTQINIIDCDTKERSTINIGHIVLNEESLCKIAESLIYTIY